MNAHPSLFMLVVVASVYWGDFRPLLGTEPARAKAVAIEVTYTDLEKHPENYVGKLVTIVCFARTSPFGGTELFEKLAGAVNEDHEPVGRFVTVKDMTFALAPTPPKIPVWCKASGVFTPNLDLKKRPETQWLGILERIERLDLMPLSEEMIYDAYAEIREKKAASKAK